MRPATDLVRDSKLRTSYRDGITRHTIETSDRHHGHRKIKRDQRWQRVGDLLGEGAFGIVWKEKLVGGESDVKDRAVKRIRKRVGNASSVDYSRELEAIAKFSRGKYKSFFVESYGWFESQDHVFITMEYFEHGDLQHYMSRVGKMPEEDIRQISYQILEGVQEMHDNGFAHRDLKPSNILIRRTRDHQEGWWVKIGDFGISKRAEEGMTALRTVSGTEGFLAPEVLVRKGSLFLQPAMLSKLLKNKHEYTFVVDIWALGEITYRAICGTSPFATDLAAYADGQIKFPEGRLKELNISSQGIELIHQLMKVLPGERLTATEALDHLWFDAFRNSSSRSTSEFQSVDENHEIPPTLLSPTLGPAPSDSFNSEARGFAPWTDLDGNNTLKPVGSLPNTHQSAVPLSMLPPSQDLPLGASARTLNVAKEDESPSKLVKISPQAQKEMTQRTSEEIKVARLEREIMRKDATRASDAGLAYMEPSPNDQQESHEIDETTEQQAAEDDAFRKRYASYYKTLASKTFRDGSYHSKWIEEQQNQQALQEQYAYAYDLALRSQTSRENSFHGRRIEEQQEQRIIQTLLGSENAKDNFRMNGASSRSTSRNSTPDDIPQRRSLGTSPARAEVRHIPEKQRTYLSRPVPDPGPLSAAKSDAESEQSTVKKTHYDGDTRKTSEGDISPYIIDRAALREQRRAHMYRGYPSRTEDDVHSQHYRGKANSKNDEPPTSKTYHINSHERSSGSYATSSVTDSEITPAGINPRRGSNIDDRNSELRQREYYRKLALSRQSEDAMRYIRLSKSDTKADAENDESPISKNHYISSRGRSNDSYASSPVTDSETTPAGVYPRRGSNIDDRISELRQSEYYRKLALSRQSEDAMHYIRLSKGDAEKPKIRRKKSSRQRQNETKKGKEPSQFTRLLQATGFIPSPTTKEKYAKFPVVKE